MDTRALLFTLALALAFGAGAAPYKWVDKDGRVHYSDKPPPGVKTEQVELKPLTEVTSQPVPQSDGSSASAAPADPAAEATGYSSMRITSPADQSTHRDPSAAITIGVALEPALKDGDSIEYTLDGKVVQSPLTGLDRGSHQVGARVVSANGGQHIAASPVTIYVHRTTVPEVTPPKAQPKKKTP
jgi:hypothetical protein